MYKELLRDILLSVLDSISVIERRVAPIQKEDDFISSEQGEMTLDSIAMRLQHIGESIKKIFSNHPDLFNTYTEIKWEEIIQFRDFISHHYEMLNHEIIFKICKHDLPLLKVTLEKILTQVEQNNDSG